MKSLVPRAAALSGWHWWLPAQVSYSMWHEAPGARGELGALLEQRDAVKVDLSPEAAPRGFLEGLAGALRPACPPPQLCRAQAGLVPEESGCVRRSQCTPRVLRNHRSPQAAVRA